MVTFTLDHNCIIAIDKCEQPAESYLRALLARHDAGEVSVRLVATSASERQQGRPYLTNFGEFQARLAALGLGHLELLRPVMVLGVCYLDWSLVAGPDDIALLEDIHRVLFPGHAFGLTDALAAARPGADLKVIERKWRNHALDVHALWCHIHYGADVFVTSDGDFFGQRQRPLARLGAPRSSSPRRCACQVSRAGIEYVARARAGQGGATGVMIRSALAQAGHQLGPGSITLSWHPGREAA